MSFGHSNVLPAAAFLPGLCPFPASLLPAAHPATATPASEAPRPQGRDLLSLACPSAAVQGWVQGAALTRPHLTLQLPEHRGCDFTCACARELHVRWGRVLSAWVCRVGVVFRVEGSAGWGVCRWGVCRLGGLQAGAHLQGWGPCSQAPCCSCCLPEAFRRSVSFLLIL